MLPPEAIQQFKKIYAQVFRENLSDEEAAWRANYVLDFFKAVYLPVEEDEREQLMKGND